MNRIGLSVFIIWAIVSPSPAWSQDAVLETSPSMATAGADLVVDSAQSPALGHRDPLNSNETQAVKADAAQKTSPAPVASSTRIRSDNNAPMPAANSLENKDLKSQVKALRAERYDKMPYLDKRLVQEMISPRKVRNNQNFTRLKSNKSLNDVIDQAIQSNTEARTAWEKMALGRRKIMAAVRNLFPEASYELNDKSGQLNSLNYNSGSYRFKLVQPIFRGGMLWNTFLQGKAEFEAAENEYDAVLGQLVLDVSKAYFDIDRTNQLVGDYQEAVERLKKFQDISSKKFRESIISEIENLNAQSLYGEITFGKENATQELELAKLELQKLLNLQIRDHIDVVPLYDVAQMMAKEEAVSKTDKTLQASDLFVLPAGMSNVEVDHLVDLAYKNRPELRVEAARLEAAQLAQKIKFGKFLPQANVTLEMGNLGEAYDFQANDPKWRKEFRCLLELNWNAGGNKIGYSFDHDERAPSVTEFEGSRGTMQTNSKFSIGILDGLNDFVESKQAEVQKLEQVVELERTEKKVIQDVKQAYFDYQKNEIQLKSLVQKVNYRNRVAQLKLHELEQNQAQISEYLEVERDRLDDLTKLRKAIADYLVARATLNYAIGIPNYLKFGEDNESFGK